MSVGGGASQVNQWRMCGGPRETRRERQMERGPQGWGEEGGGVCRRVLTLLPGPDDGLI